MVSMDFSSSKAAIESVCCSTLEVVALVEEMETIWKQRTAEAEQLGLKALACLDSFNAPNAQLKAQVHFHLCRIYGRLSKLSFSLAHGLQAQTILEFLPEQKLTFDNFFLLGRAYNYTGELALGLDYFRKCHAYYAREGLTEELCKTLVYMGENYLVSGDLESTEKTQKQALKLASLHPNSFVYFETFITGAKFYLLQGDTDVARHLLSRVQDYLQQGQDPCEEGIFLYTSGELALAEGKVEEARDRFLGLVSLVEDKHLLALLPTAVGALLHLSRIAFQREELEEAEQLALRALETLTTNVSALQEQITSLLYEIYKAQGDYSSSFQYLQRSIQLRKQLHEKKQTMEQMRLEWKGKANKLRLQLQEEYEKRQEQKKRHQRLFAAKSEFIKLLLHDLSSPLNKIQDLISALTEEVHEMDSDSTFYNEEIERQAQQMLLLTKSLLKLTQLEAQALNLEVVSVDKMLEVLVQSQSPRARWKGLQLDFANELEAAVEWECDVPSFSEAITNLLSNAIKYTPSGGHVCVRLYQDQRELVIEVQDNGEGIPKAIQSMIFERFYRAPRHRTQVEGSGLGLAIVKAVVEQHNGSIELKSEVDRGSVFRLKFEL